MQKHLQRLMPLLEHVASLFIVFLLLAAAAAWTGTLFGQPFAAAEKSGLASEATAKTIAMPTAEEMTKLGLEGATLTPRDSASWNVSTGGTVVTSAPLVGKDVVGFAGATPVFVYIDAAGCISKIVAAENVETTDFFRNAEEGVLQHFKAKPTAEQAAALHVDAVSGATYSSVALAKNIQAAAAHYAAVDHQASAAPAIGWLKTSAVVLALAFGLLVAWRWRGVKWLRAVLHVVNIIVLGFWTGQYLSLSLLRGWVAQGVEALTVLPVLIILALVVVLPFMGRRRHYCTWVCPLGSAQSLVAMLPVPKVSCSQMVVKWMRRVRLLAFCLLMFLLWTGLGDELGVLCYEPYGFFAASSATTAVIVLGGIIIVASLFVPNLWCRSLCPLGQLIDLSEEGTAASSITKKKQP